MKIGDKVVCVDDNWRHNELLLSRPVLGRVYVICHAMWWEPTNELGLWFLGIKNPYSPVGIEYGFVSTHFRLLDEMKRKISNHDSTHSVLNNETVYAP